MEAQETKLQQMNAEFSKTLAEFEAASGISPDILEAHEDTQRAGYDQDLSRSHLAEENVQTTRMLDSYLPEALERLRSLLPLGWLDQEPRQVSRLNFHDSSTFLSLTKGMRVKSEMPPTHRFRQMFHVAEDMVADSPRLDHFAAAMALPSLGHFGVRLDLLDQIGGNVQERLERLWVGPSDDVDSAIFELLTAQACVEVGRAIDFTPETNEPSPDMLCHDRPFVIECKRQRAFSDYELEEERIMGVVFTRLRAETQRRGCFGMFNLHLTVEATAIDISEVVTALLAQRLAVCPDRGAKYAWGDVSYRELPAAFALPTVTRLYSPNLLEWVFGWSTDLPEADGLCCWYKNGNEPVIDEIYAPTGMSWINSSTQAVRRRTWAPVSLFGDAANQIPGGEFAIVYIAYTEGTRREMADMRLEAFNERMLSWSHRPEIRLPLTFLNRLYPRALGDGRADLIESTIPLLSQLYGDVVATEDFPANIFTIGPDLATRS